MTEKEVAIVVGAGPGLGNALVARFAEAGMTVAAVSRRGIAPKLQQGSSAIHGYACDATMGDQVKALFASLEQELGPPDVVVFNVGTWDRASILQISDELFMHAWRTGCFGGFLVGREAARRLVPLGRGTLIFTGASGSLRGRPSFASFAAAKAGLRAVAQAMAREFGPLGLHVAHVVIDGGIDGERLNSRFPQRRAEKGADGLLNIDAIADSYWHIHRQAPSAWSHEIDLRPYKETF